MNYVEESVLLVRVPEAEVLVGPYRDRYDPASSEGIPAHVTLHYPFKQPHLVSEFDLSNLERFFALQSRFTFELTGIARFPGVLYLTPEPADPFIAMMSELARRYPEWPPYGGKFEGFTPHLTVAHVEDVAQFRQIEEDFGVAAQEHLPIGCRAEEVWLFESADGTWRPRSRFALG